VALPDAAVLLKVLCQAPLSPWHGGTELVFPLQAEAGQWDSSVPTVAQNSVPVARNSAYFFPITAFATRPGDIGSWFSRTPTAR
jgi:hypothetical protein